MAGVAAPIQTMGTKKMENLNFNDDAIIDPRDAELAELRRQLAEANRRADYRAAQLDEFGDAIMGVIGDKVEALATSAARDMLESDFDIHDYESDIDDMIAERLPERDDDEHREAVESIVKEIIEGATLRLDTI